MGFTLKSVKRVQDQIETHSDLELDHTVPNIELFPYYSIFKFKFLEKLCFQACWPAHTDRHTCEYSITVIFTKCNYKNLHVISMSFLEKKLNNDYNL